MVYSMTAFARGERHLPHHTLSCELRSVNQRHLDAVFRLPDAARACEPDLREQLRKLVSRGKVESVIRLQQDHEQDEGWTLNQPLLNRVIGTLTTLARSSEHLAGADPLEVLKWPGVLVEEEIPADVLAKEISLLFAETLRQLLDARRREGEQLKALINDRLLELDAIIGQVRELIPGILESSQARLRERLREVREELDPSRLEQEMVYLAQKSDVDEELDRLATHVREVRRVLDSDGQVGRRLDFLMQELNREANTLSSKSLAAETSLKAVDLKVLIEQMREQVQNIE